MEYTQGYLYGGEGSIDLAVIRNFDAVAWGRVTNEGVPEVHVKVTASLGRRVVGQALTNSQGWYVMPRSKVSVAEIALSVRNHVATIISSRMVARRFDFRV